MAPTRARGVLLAAVVVALFPSGAAAHEDGMTLTVSKGPTPDDVVLDWSGGEPIYQVYRAPDPVNIVDPGNQIGEPAVRHWDDVPGPGSIFFYQITSPCPYNPPEICNGVDDDCDGTVDGPGSELSCNLANATAVCLAGSCAIDDCDPNFDDCNLVASDGCEIEIGSDPLNCGSCGGICSANNITPSCSSGVCDGTCDSGFDDCNSDKLADGCEADLGSPSDCGFCGNSCDDADACTGDFCDPFGMCGHVDASACGTSACASGACAFADTDGDNLNDTWETNGYIDLDCDGVFDPGSDTLLPGASTGQPDIFVKLDYMVLPGSGTPCTVPEECAPGEECSGGFCTGHTHEPDPAAIQMVVDAFSAQGIQLHIDPVHDALPHAEVIVTEPLPASCTGPDAVDFYSIKAAHLDPVLAPAYHYAVFGHYSTCADESSCATCPALSGGWQPVFGATGMAERPGNDLIVSFGLAVDFGNPVTDLMVAGTFMHELGHNLGLDHSGDTDTPKNEPNYISVMNPRYQFGIGMSAAPGPYPTSPVDPSVDWRVDFSGEALAPLEESGVPGVSGGLDENAGVSGSPASLDVIVFTIDGGATFHYAPSNGTPIDWNDNGSSLDMHVVQDVSGDGTESLLTGHDDWSNLEYAFQCEAGGFQDGAVPPRAARRECTASSTTTLPTPVCDSRRRANPVP